MKFEDFKKSEYAEYEVDAVVWVDEKITILLEDTPDDLNECIDGINKRIAWIENSKEVVMRELLNEFLSEVQEKDEDVTEKDFLANLRFDNIVIYPNDNYRAEIHFGFKEEEWFGDHYITVDIGEDNEISFLLEG